MKAILFVFLLIVNMQFVFSQTVQDYDKRINELKAQKNNLKYQIKSLNNDIKNIDEQIRVLEQNKVNIVPKFESEDGIKAYVGESGGVLRRQPNINGTIITNLKANDVIYVQNEKHNLYLKVNYQGTFGFLNYTSIKSNPEVDNILMQKTTSPTSETEIYKVDKSSSKYKRLVKIYGDDVTIKIMNHKLWKGMSTGQILESAGKPNSVKKENTEKGLLENWDYSDKTLKILNGSLDSWKMK